VFIVDRKRGLLVFDPCSGKPDAVLARVRREEFKGLNDPTFARNGDLSFTGQGQSALRDPTGQVFRLRSDRPARMPARQRPQPERADVDRRRAHALCLHHARQPDLARAVSRLRSPRGLWTTNVCSGGPEGRALFATVSDTEGRARGEDAGRRRAVTHRGRSLGSGS
jgi:sugar lactone lactonase YvrE